MPSERAADCPAMALTEYEIRTLAEIEAHLATVRSSPPRVRTAARFVVKMTTLVAVLAGATIVCAGVAVGVVAAVALSWSVLGLAVPAFLVLVAVWLAILGVPLRGGVRSRPWRARARRGSPAH